MTADSGKLASPETLAFMQRLLAGEKIDCSCCGRYAQIYRRRIHHSIARQLVELYGLGGGRERRFVHGSQLIPKGNTGTGDIGKGRYWGLIEPMLRVSKLDNASGYWRLTGLGCDFVQAKATIQKVALVFDDKVIGFEGPEVSIQQCWDKRFDYAKILTDEGGDDAADND